MVWSKIFRDGCKRFPPDTDMQFSGCLKYSEMDVNHLPLSAIFYHPLCLKYSEMDVNAWLSFGRVLAF